MDTLAFLNSLAGDAVYRHLREEVDVRVEARQGVEHPDHPPDCLCLRVVHSTGEDHRRLPK
jgi:hypothetical protein